MNRFFILSLLFFWSLSHVQSQSLYHSRDIKKAYGNETRSVDGRPGKYYWQNSGKYDMTISVAPPGRMVHGSASVIYKNSSPDTLHNIVIRLTQNNHKPGSARFGNAAPAYLTEGITIDTFLINGRSGAWTKNMGKTTWQLVKLNRPLYPHDSLSLSYAWHYPVSEQSGREGMIDSTTFFLAYFYPRIAVYDDYNGWDQVEFTGAPEFYNDFNDYQVKVNVPAGYVVWGTGDLLNPDNVLQPAITARLEKAMQGSTPVTIATKEEMTAGKVTLPNKTNTWRFSASNVSDVAFAVSNHFVWDAASALVDSTTGRRAEMHAVYADTASAFRNMVRDGAHALNWFSHHLPGVPYPFPKMTAFQGGADMEFPMMVNDSSIPGPDGRRVANHEIAHTWFPFYMGTNETRYAFMDEGWAAALELLIAPSYTDKAVAEETFKKGRVGRWIYNPSAVTDLPVITPSFELKEAYRTNAYGKPALAYLALIDLLGDQLFKKCLLEYMARWNGKHPVPWDFFYTFNDVSGRNLNWFWDNWFFSNNYIDISVHSVTKNRSGYALQVENKGGFAVPFNVEVTYQDGTHAVYRQTSQIWSAGQKTAEILLKGSKAIESLTLNTNLFLDVNPGDNNWKLKPST